ncbi:DNA adenine methylase [Delftia sp. Lp-1]|uniref:DNA adenine methylase n=1 Tax=Delftia sp. Lp-1 TaxID=682863 RepID=UPI001E4547C7|nr:DNA adenine methylase [Delftia sp. Lp-1]MCB4787048.1 DNA adenine methylase [Delftia sp. Lp-1]
MFSNKLYTPFRYPGGKGQFAPLVAQILHASGLDGGHYLEPYAGGAGVALVLLFDGLVEQVHINDADPAVAIFWRIAVSQPQNLLEMVANEVVNIEAWHHWRAVMRGEVLANDVEKAFATLFMNRTNRSGILKAGVIGGKSQNGPYKLDARFMRDELCGRLERIARYSSFINVYEEDAHALLSRCVTFLPEKTLIYLDPPYYVKGEGLYRNFYKHEDHLKIANLLANRCFQIPWMVSYDNAKEIREMYSYAKSFTYGLNYSAQRRYTGSEVMFFSERVAAPQQLLNQDAA